MTRYVRTTIALLAVLLLPMSALAQTAAAGDEKKPAEEAKPAEAPKPAPAQLPSVLSKLNVTFYGYVNFDAIYDTTRTFDGLGLGLGGVARDTVQAGDKGRTIFGVSDTRFGFRIAAPEYQGIKASGVVETDFGALAGGTVSEGSRYTNTVLRVRQANFKLETPVVDITMGQTWNVYGWLTSYFPAAATKLPIPAEPFGRNPQLRLSKLIKSPSFNVEVAAAALRPPQRDAVMPDFQAGARLLLNNYKGIHTGGAGGTGPYPASIAVSGAYRQFKAAFTGTPPTYDEKSVTGNALSIDALIPVIPTSGPGDMGNKLTLVGTYVITKGAGDLLGGISVSGKPNSGTFPAGTTAAVLPDGNLVVYDALGEFHAVNWTGFLVGADYYLPPSGRIFVSATYSNLKSDNVSDYADGANLTGIFTELTHYDGNIFFDVTPSVRLILSYQHRESKYAGDGVVAKSDRAHFSAYYNF